MNGVNLDQFQFEYDLTWMAFFQNAAGRNYARYGGREDSNAESHLSKDSLLRVMKQVLELHESGSVQADSKYEPLATEVTTPSAIPTLKTMMEKRKDSTCIHCHDIKNSRFRHLHNTNELKKSMVFTYPSPSLIGLHVDRDQQDLTASVDRDSPAWKAGVREGDLLQSSDGQRILTFADFTRVLELAPSEGALTLTVKRDRTKKTVTVKLPPNWKKSSDPSWRPSVGMIGPGGGFWGKSANDQQRKRFGLRPDELAIRVTFIWAQHAKDAGVKMSDIVVSVDGEKSNMTMRQFHAWLQLNRAWGDEVELAVLRKGKRITLNMTLPDGPSE
jgi:predicted metalloprotease with PDZ domain